MINNVVLLIIAHAGYHPVEYGYTRAVLEKAGIQVVVASDKAGIADATPSEAHSQVCSDPRCVTIVTDYPHYAKVHVDLMLDAVNPEKYDGIFIIGGPGAMEFLDNPVVYAIMQTIAKSGKPFGAICVSPRILAHAGVLQGKKATGWNGDHLLDDIFKNFGVQYLKKPVVIDGDLITADGPDAAEEFGVAIAGAIFNIGGDYDEYKK